VARAWADDAFKRRLLAEPAAALRETGLDVPPGAYVRVVEDTDRVLHLTLPQKPGPEEPATAELRRAADAWNLRGDEVLAWGGLKGEFFSGLGFFVARHLFGEELCAELRAAMQGARLAPAAVIRPGSPAPEEERRSPNAAAVPTDLLNSVRERLLALTPQLQGHFQVALAGCEPPRFLVYREGDSIQAHLDGGRAPDNPEWVRKRRVSVVVLLNGQAEAPGPNDYSGGALTFYLKVGPGLGRFSLAGECGQLIGFPSHTVHEVTPVTRGRRYSVVSWFHAASPTSGEDCTGHSAAGAGPPERVH
jgi:PKHD-type hydroxylase/SM-20-related protein